MRFMTWLRNIHRAHLVPDFEEYVGLLEQKSSEDGLARSNAEQERDSLSHELERAKESLAQQARTVRWLERERDELNNRNQMLKDQADLFRRDMERFDAELARYNRDAKAAIRFDEEDRQRKLREIAECQRIEHVSTEGYDWDDE